MKLYNAVLFACLFFYSLDVVAHAEHDKARFVAVNGADQGRCDNRFRPCQTIAYAAEHANKGDLILVAKGHYPIKTESELMHLIGQVVPVRGGYDQLDNYQFQNPDQYPTTLSGVPMQFSQQLSDQGFNVLVDAKSMSKSLEATYSSLRLMQNRQSAAECIDGLSAGFECQNTALLAHIPLGDFANGPTAANDIWGHIDLNTQKEYAIMGLNNGISVIDVSEPTAPTIVGSIAGAASTWRDIKVYQFYDQIKLRWQAFAYATTEASEGISIIDLNQLPEQISLVQRQTSDQSAHNIYISNVDYGLNIPLPRQEAQVHIVGSNNFAGAFRSYSLAAPTNLSATYSPSASNRSNYTHDASSLLINDTRAQSDCQQAAQSPCMVMLDFNEDALRIWDHTLPQQAEQLSSSSYPNVEYTHSGWWTEDKQFVIVHDELDEQRHQLNTTLNIFDISDLRAPLLTGTWTGPTSAIDHNGFVRGNRYYMSNYTRGLTILDISDPSAPAELAYFDTFPSNNGNSFNGAWGVYPYLPSGNILVSDINSGLFIIQDNSKQDSDSFSFTQGGVMVSEGQTLTLEVSKSGTAASQVSYEVLYGSAQAEDLSLQGSDTLSGQLQWQSGDTSNKTINIELTQDGINETAESFFVRLFDPRNGATLSNQNIAQVTIQGTSQAGLISFQQESLTVKETDGDIDIAIARIGGTLGEISVSYQLHSATAIVGEDVLTSSGTLTWADGDNADKTITLSLENDQLSESTESFEISLSSNNETILSTLSRLTITIRDDDSNLAPIVNAGQDRNVNTRQSVSLNASANDPEDQGLIYLWQQTSGPSVSISNTTSLRSNFVAPNTSATLEFSFTATDDFNISASDTITITVVAPQSTTNTGSSGGALSYLMLSLGIALLCLRRIVARLVRL